MLTLLVSFPTLPVYSVQLIGEVVVYKSQVVQHLGSLMRIAEVLNISRPSVSQWGEIIPEKQALRLEKITHGQLKYDPALYSAEAISPDPASKHSDSKPAA